MYRNLADLYRIGEIIKIKSKTGIDHYDGNINPHIHFECSNCQKIYDIFLKEEQIYDFDNEIKKLAEQIDAKLEETNICILGLCKNCK